MGEKRDTRWLLLIHQLPPKPDYFPREDLAALATRRRGRNQEPRFTFCLGVIKRWRIFNGSSVKSRKAGGDASLCEAGFVEGLSDSQIEALFRAARDADYAAIADEARTLAKKHHPRRCGEDARDELETDASRLRKTAC